MRGGLHLALENGFHPLHATALRDGREADYQQSSQGSAYQADCHRYEPAGIRPQVGPQHELVAQSVRLDQKQPLTSRSFSMRHKFTDAAYSAQKRGRWPSERQFARLGQLRWRWWLGRLSLPRRRLRRSVKGQAESGWILRLNSTQCCGSTKTDASFDARPGNELLIATRQRRGPPRSLMVHVALYRTSGKGRSQPILAAASSRFFCAKPYESS